MRTRHRARRSPARSDHVNLAACNIDLSEVAKNECCAHHPRTWRKDPRCETYAAAFAAPWLLVGRCQGLATVLRLAAAVSMCCCDGRHSTISTAGSRYAQRASWASSRAPRNDESDTSNPRSSGDRARNLPSTYL